MDQFKCVSGTRTYYGSEDEDEYPPITSQIIQQPQVLSHQDVSETWTYYGFKNEAEYTVPPSQPSYPPIKPQTIQQPQVLSQTDLITNPISLRMIHDKILEINTKIDNVICRVANLEQLSRTILDTVMEIRRSFPRFVTTPAFQTPSFCTKYV